jgi:hypothetical protein
VTEPTAPPQLSPDGKFYWSDGQWKPYLPESAKLLAPVAAPEPEHPPYWDTFAEWAVWAQTNISNDEKRVLAAAAAATWSVGNQRQAATHAAFDRAALAKVDKLDPDLVAYVRSKVAVKRSSGSAPADSGSGAVVVRSYRGNARSVQQQLQRDASAMASAGYDLVGQAHIPGRSGCLRLIMLGGIGALVLRPPDTLTATYRKR